MTAVAIIQMRRWRIVIVSEEVLSEARLSIAEILLTLMPIILAPRKKYASNNPSTKVCSIATAQSKRRQKYLDVGASGKTSLQAGDILSKPISIRNSKKVLDGMKDPQKMAHPAIRMAPLTIRPSWIPVMTTSASSQCPQEVRPQNADEIKAVIHIMKTNS